MSTLIVVTSSLQNENIVLQQAAEGDCNAFLQLYNHYRRKVYFIAWRLLKSETDAEDVVQEIFTRLWINREKLAEIDYFNSYLNTLIRNHVFNCLRKKANEEIFIIDAVKETKEPAEDLSQLLEWRELQAILHKAMNTLPPQQKKVFQLGRIEGWKHDEIAAELGISKETVKKHIMTATATIKTLLHKKGKIALLSLILFLH